MEEQDSPRTLQNAITSQQQQATSSTVKRDSSVTGFFGKSGYKFWVLAVILLLAFWSMFTGSVSLKWSSDELTTFSDDFELSVHDDLDFLELEERETVVRKMWDVYTQSASVRLPRFWLEAFEAAYEYLSSDVPGVRDAAISEIAKLSMHSFNFDLASS
ncbi:Detected protein of confused Function [Hibiscus syriacus]|uniref:Detected protein of confused Function n=1 Tax=Hibiscus syriacus TaxID=106335 RepID=A0A6A2Y3L8_HIBSY|nr:uncharacterized protein LOC120167512 [Hibiscus syriacus]KAE8675275.1 Detected protein of confused Function [Hibiscus syriacus]